jgi:hypothetical protein
VTMRKLGLTFFIALAVFLPASEADFVDNLIGTIMGLPELPFRAYHGYVGLHYQEPETPVDVPSVSLPKDTTTTVVQSDCPVEKSRWDGTHKNLKFKSYYPSDDPSGLSGYIHSPDYHGTIQYENRQDCWWHIHAPVGNVIKLTFLDFGIQKPRYGGSGCSNDYLFIDGHGKYCGRINYRQFDEYGFSDPESPPNFMYSTGNSLSMNFHADHYGSERGFEIRYETVPESEAPTGEGHFWSFDNSLLDETSSLIKSEMGINRQCNSYGCTIFDWSGNRISTSLEGERIKFNQ